MNYGKEYRIQFNDKTSIPQIGGTLTNAQRAEIEVWTHVPPFDGFTLQLEGCDGVMSTHHSELLAGFRGMVLSELISIEYLLAAVPLADKLKNKTDFSLKFWNGMNNDNRMFGQRINDLRKWINGQFIQVTPENFDTATKVLSDVRNSLAHYPIQAAFNGTFNTLTPFVYRASKDQMVIFDQHKITVVGTFCSMVKSELQIQFNQLNNARNTKT